MIPTAMKESYFVKRFFLLIICPLVGGALAGVLFGVIAGVDVLSLGVSMRTSRIVAAVFGTAVGLTISYFLFRRVAVRFITRDLPTEPSRSAGHAETDQSTRLEFRMRYIDYLLFNTVHLFLNPIMQGLVVGFAGFIFFVELGEKTAAESLMPAARWFGLIWIAQIAYLGAALYTSREDTNLTDHVLDVRDDALYDLTKFNESKFFWPSVLRVVRRPGFVAVYVAQHAAQVIPTRAFENKEAQRMFVKLIKDKMRAA